MTAVAAEATPLSQPAALLRDEIRRLACDSRVGPITAHDHSHRFMVLLPKTEPTERLMRRRVALDTAAMRALYGEIKGDSLLPFTRQLAHGYAGSYRTQGSRGSLQNRYVDASGSYASVAHLIGLCLACAHVERLERAYKEDLRIWEEAATEGDPSGPKPRRWWADIK